MARNWRILSLQVIYYGYFSKYIGFLDFELFQRTIWAGIIPMPSYPSRILQITPKIVHIFSGDGTFHVDWSPSFRISLASVNPKLGLILVTSGCGLYLLKIESAEISLVEKIECNNEIACIDIFHIDTGLF